jgi:hypothetical protein
MSLFDLTVTFKVRVAVCQARSILRRRLRGTSLNAKLARNTPALDGFRTFS